MSAGMMGSVAKWRPRLALGAVPPSRPALFAWCSYSTAPEKSGNIPRNRRICFSLPVTFARPCPDARAQLGLTTTVRSFARSSAPCDETPEDKARTFVMSIGHDRDVANGVVSALSEAGMSGEALLSMVRSMAGRWEVGEDEGLEALVASVKQQLAKKKGKGEVKVWCVPPNAWASGEGMEGETETEESRKAMMSRAFPVSALEGISLTDVAKFGDGEGASTLGEYIECACSGIMACSTCHVVVDQEWLSKVGEPCEAEQDMLDLAYSPRETSRLGCQIVLTKELDGMVVKIPGGANNLMDFVPFEG